MEGNHVNVFVRDLTDGLARFARVWAVEPAHREERMAVLQFGPILLVLDQDDEETVTTIGYATGDCDADFRTVVGRGAQMIEEPADRSWGVRVAYLTGQAASVWNWSKSCPKSTRGAATPRPDARRRSPAVGLRQG